MSTKIFNLSMPKELVDLIDNQAKLFYATRSEYIKQAVMSRLKADGALNGEQKAKPVTLEELKREQLKKFLSNIDTTL